MAVLEKGKQEVNRVAEAEKVPLAIQEKPKIDFEIINHCYHTGADVANLVSWSCWLSKTKTCAGCCYFTYRVKSNDRVIFERDERSEVAE